MDAEGANFCKTFSRDTDAHAMCSTGHGVRAEYIGDTKCFFVPVWSENCQQCQQLRLDDLATPRIDCLGRVAGVDDKSRVLGDELHVVGRMVGRNDHTILTCQRFGG